MSAVSLPPTPTTRPATSPSSRRHLRLVESPPSTRLAPSGPFQAWRRRLGVLVVLAALVVLAGQALLPAGAPTAPSIVPVATETVVVQPGQTLWDVAEVHAPAEVGAADYVRELAELNGVDNGSVTAWQVLRLPNG